MNCSPLIAIVFHQLVAAGVALTMLLTLRPSGLRLHLGLLLLLLLPCAVVAGTNVAGILQIAAYLAIATSHSQKGSSA